MDFLDRMARNRRSARKIHAEVGTASSEQLLCLVEICLNILRKRVPLKGRLLRRLRAHAEQIRALSRARSANRVLRILHQQQQHGRGIPAVAGLVASVVLPWLSTYINKSMQGEGAATTTTSDTTARQ